MKSIYLPIFSNYPQAISSKICELAIYSKPLTADDLCALPTEFTSLVDDIYSLRTALSERTEAALELKKYIEDFLKNSDNQEYFAISPQGVVNFLSSTSGYLFNKVGEALNYLPQIPEIRSSLEHIFAARVNKEIKQSALEVMVNLSIDGAFKAVASGIMNTGSVENCVKDALEETVSRVKYSALGVGAATLISNTTDLKTSELKQPIRAAAKTLAKGGNSISAGVAALASAVTDSLPKYTSEVITHGVIGGAIGYARTGSISGVVTGALENATARGIYHYGWELAGGKTKLNKLDLIEAGAARIASKGVAKIITQNFPLTSIAAVAGVAIAENMGTYFQNSKDPIISAAKDSISDSLPALKEASTNQALNETTAGTRVDRMTRITHHDQNRSR